MSAGDHLLWPVQRLDHSLSAKARQIVRHDRLGLEVRSHFGRHLQAPLATLLTPQILYPALFDFSACSF